jgi:hypothetical protein
MKKLLGLLLLLAACEPPVSLILELNFTKEILDSSAQATELVISFCPTLTSCQRVIDFETQSISLNKALKAKETIAFAPVNALSPQEIFFEFILIGENAAKEPEVIASGALTEDIAAPSYLKRQKIAVGLLPGTSLQAIQDHTIDLGTRVTVQNLSVHGVGATNNVFFAQIASSTQFPASPFFSGLTVRSSDPRIPLLSPRDCLTASGILVSGDNGEVELQADQLSDAVGCINSDSLPISANALQLSNDPQPLDGVLLRIEEVEIQRCSFNVNFFCAFDFLDNVEVEVSDFIFEGAAFNNTMSDLDTSGSTVTLVGVGEVFQNDLFLLLPRNIGDLIR